MIMIFFVRTYDSDIQPNQPILKCLRFFSFDFPSCLMVGCHVLTYNDMLIYCDLI